MKRHIAISLLFIATFKSDFSHKALSDFLTQSLISSSGSKGDKILGLGARVDSLLVWQCQRLYRRLGWTLNAYSSLPSCTY